MSSVDAARENNRDFRNRIVIRFVKMI